MDRLEPPDTLVVTGAAGWFGRAFLVRAASAEIAARVVAAVRDPAEADALRASLPGTGRDVEIVTADVSDADATRRALDVGAGAVDRVVDVVHAAAVIHPGRVAEFHRVNDRGTANLVAAAQRAGVRRFVHVSSNSPFGTNPAPTDAFGEHEPYHPYLGYGWSKMAAELHVLDAADAARPDPLDAVIVRPPWFYGPWQPPRQTTFFAMVRAGRFPVFGDGTQRRSMVYVDNLVDGVLAALRTPGVGGRGYWIADAEPYPMADVVEAVRTALRDHGLECRESVLRMPPAIGAVAEGLDRVVQRFGRYQQQLHVLGELRHTIAVDIAAARRDLGYEPAVGLLDGMRRSVRWCLDQGYQL